MPSTVILRTRRSSSRAFLAMTDPDSGRRQTSTISSPRFGVSAFLRSSFIQAGMPFHFRAKKTQGRVHRQPIESVTPRDACLLHLMDGPLETGKIGEEGGNAPRAMISFQEARERRGFAAQHPQDASISSCRAERGTAGRCVPGVSGKSAAWVRPHPLGLIVESRSMNRAGTDDETLIPAARRPVKRQAEAAG